MNKDIDEYLTRTTRTEYFKPPYPVGRCAMCREKRKLIKKRPIKCCFKCNQIGGIFRDKRKVQIGGLDISMPVLMGAAGIMAIYALKPNQTKRNKADETKSNSENTQTNNDPR